ncbi:MAG: hypothetical protein H0Z33_14040 [Bacillaceae bacterium]|nr:hypothetical protein [Bacillaceae bacterium]
MKRLFVHLIFIFCLLLVAFFGLGPVLMADGSLSERMLTLGVVSILFLGLGWLYRYYPECY